MIHAENICAQFSKTDSMKSVMETVVKIVEHIRANSMIHHQFMEPLKEVDDEFNDLVFVASACCLSHKEFYKVLLCC